MRSALVYLAFLQGGFGVFNAKVRIAVFSLISLSGFRFSIPVCEYLHFNSSSLSCT